MNRIKLYLLLFFLIIPSVFSQIRYQVGLGSGFYFTDHSPFYDNSQNYLAGLLKVNYIIKDERKRASVELFAIPEFFGTDNSVKSLKLKAEAQYSEIHRKLTWGISLLKKNYFYQGLNIKNYFDIYFLHSFINWKIDKLPVKTSVGFAYQDISGSYSQLSDLLYIDNRFIHSFSSYTNISYGIYIERFSLSSASKNSGWRIGPLFTVNHLRDFVFNLQLKFVIHTSELTNQFSHESILRLVSGKFLTRALSLFVLADYSWRNFKYDPQSEVLPYSLIDSENNIHLKLSYFINNSLEVYLKGGYFNQDFLDRNLSLKGWNILAGFKFSN